MAKKATYRVDPKLSGKKYAWKYEGSDIVFVSRAMYTLIRSNPDAMANTLQVKIVTKREPDERLLP